MRRLERWLEGKEAVIFDLDGTLVDSMWMWSEIDREYLSRFGFSCPPDLSRATEGMSFTETAHYFKERFALKDSIEQIKADWMDMSLNKYQNEVALKPEALHFLQELKKRGISMGIATSNAREMVEAVLTSCGIRSFFQNVSTSCEVAAGKPAPDIYQKVAKELGVPCTACLVFEDVPAGIVAGKRAGMEVIAVWDEASSHLEEEKRSLADGWIADYGALFLEEGL